MIQKIRRVVRAKPVEVVSGYVRNGEHAVMHRVEYTLSCGHVRTQKAHHDRHIPLKMTCKEC